ncbi:MAG: A/G-specific adenine glycosylase, partial [Planctomycetia bacterium]
MRPLDWWNSLSASAFRRRLLAWYDAHGRSFPWRDTRDPYHLWVSEIMLQQTTTATVGSFFPRFLAAFPSIHTLAAADEQEVLKEWQGLGYYRRARNLHAAARRLVAERDGVFPSEPTEIAALPGLGRYTANAVACFAWNRRLPILEANTVRVWTRLAAADGDPARAPLNAELWAIAEASLPTTRPADFNQALMDLGATVCTPAAPRCEVCPVESFCAGRRRGDPTVFPQKAARREPVAVDAVAVVIRADDADGATVLVRRRPADGR